MKKTTLEALLRARLTDSRAMIGSLDINHDRLLLHFGAIGELARVTLSISDNEISIVLPDVLAVEWRLSEEAKRSRTPLDPDIPLTAVLVDGKLRLGSGGPEIILPAGEFVSFPKGEPLATIFDGERLLAGEGGPEVTVPEDYIVYLATALLTDQQDAEPNSGAANGATAEAGPDRETPANPAQGADGASGGPAPTPPANAGKWVDFEKVKLDDLKALAAAEGVELDVADNTRREIAAKINVKRGAIDPIGK
jgi:hypothetical protein